MRHKTALSCLALASAILGAGSAARADDGPAAGLAEIRALFDTLRPGMSVPEVADVTRRPALAGTRKPLTRWLIWSQPGAGATAVLRAAFRDGRLQSLEYETFGDRYERLVKGPDPVEVGEDELRRLWRRGRAVDDCQQAMEAFHRLLLSVQDRLTTEEQQAWVRALELRRATGVHLAVP